MAPQVGLEPTTLRLTAGCSAIELLRSVAGRAEKRAIIDFIISSDSTSENFPLRDFATLSRRFASEVRMSGGLRLLWIALCFRSCWRHCLVADDASSTTQSQGPPKAKVDTVEDTLHGHKIADPYRWLEDPGSADTQEYVRQELAYTRSILDPLPGREQIHQRLTQLSLDRHHRRSANCRKILFLYAARGHAEPARAVRARRHHGKDRTLVDVNQMSADGTVALDWWFPSYDGKYVAYGTSPSGSEESTLAPDRFRDRKVAARHHRPHPLRQVAWKKDNSGFYYSRHPKKGDVPEGEEVYHVQIFYHALGSDPDKDALDHEARAASTEDIPFRSTADDDDRWLLITVFEGWAGKSELYLQDLKAGTPPLELTSRRNSSTAVRFSAASSTSPPTKTLRAST